MKEHPDHHDAELLLRLYELRREQKLRLVNALMQTNQYSKIGVSLASTSSMIASETLSSFLPPRAFKPVDHPAVDVPDADQGGQPAIRHDPEC